MNKEIIKVFENGEFGKVRTITIGEKIYFVGKDIASGLGYKNPNDAITRHCRGYVKHDILTSGGKQKMNVIPEGDIYRLVSNSELPNAEKFESWIFDEVLPDIRKFGFYGTDNTIDMMLNNPDTMITLLTKYKEEKERAKQLEAENREKDELLLIAGEKTTIVDEFLGSDGLYGVDVVAKTLAIKGLGRNNLYEYLRDNKIIMTDIYEDKHGNKKAGSKHYEAYSQYVNQQQYFEHRSRKVQAGFKTIEQLVAMFTPKGIQWIIKRLQKDGYIAKKDLKTVIAELSQVA